MYQDQNKVISAVNMLLWFYGLYFLDISLNFLRKK